MSRGIASESKFFGFQQQKKDTNAPENSDDCHENLANCLFQESNVFKIASVFLTKTQ